MDTAIFSPSSLFHDEEDEGNVHIYHNTCGKNWKWQPTFANLFVLAGRDVEEADNGNQLQSYIERTHTFPGVVSFFSAVMISVFAVRLSCFLWDHLLVSTAELFILLMGPKICFSPYSIIVIIFLKENLRAEPCSISIHKTQIAQ